jgi:LAO/AO transport system kinase
MTEKVTTAAEFIAQIKNGSRLGLAKAITLLESDRREDQTLIDDVVRKLISETRNLSTIRIGITGPPGAGKSSLIEKIGLEFIKKNHKVAVLAIDPSSEITRGSVLGDKTRMEELSASDQAFIRPSPSRGHLGGVSVATHDAIKACELAGYDVILVETVGVGQSESQVADLVDVYTLVALPGSGDELQGIKRGILEKVDYVLVNKHDGENKIPAQLAEKQLKSSLHILRQTEIPVLLSSAIYGEGVREFCEMIENFRKASPAQIQKKRLLQEAMWTHHYIDQFLRREVEFKVETNKGLAQDIKKIESGQQNPRDVARLFVTDLLK